MLSEASGVSHEPSRSIKAELRHIAQQQDRGKIIRIVGANEDKGDVFQRYRKIESLFRQLQVSI